MRSPRPRVARGGSTIDRVRSNVGKTDREATDGGHLTEGGTQVLACWESGADELVKTLVAADDTVFIHACAAFGTEGCPATDRIDFGAGIPNISTVNRDRPCPLELTEAIKQLNRARIQVGEERIVGRNDHARVAKESLRPRIGDIQDLGHHLAGFKNGGARKTIRGRDDRADATRFRCRID